MPSSNFAASARSLAKVGAFMANGGSLNGETLLSKDGWEKLHSNKTTEWFDETFLKSTFTTGGLCYFEK